MNEFQKRIGVGEPCYAFLKHKGTIRKRPVVKQEGPDRGNIGGEQIDHWDGRVDAVVRPAAVDSQITSDLKGDSK